MSNYNYDYDDAPAPKPKSRIDLWDMLSILMLLITGCLVLYFLVLYLYPTSKLNPYPPGGKNPTATPTITPIQLDATWTPTLTPIVTPTETLLPTLTLEASPTLLSLITPSITPTATKPPKRPFSATVTYIASTIIHADSACNWQGVGGTVVDANNADITGIVIRLGGMYNGKTKNEPPTVTVTGTAPAYGKSGYEFFLGTVPILSKGELTVQILDQAGLPLSEPITLDTFNDCGKNLALVRFKKNP
ncbi:MAG: hypothetical protein IT310_07670 [Anaerolineales bacterium]|nr:hypothetical protein [Anaerolineales bacterium]